MNPVIKDVNDLQASHLIHSSFSPSVKNKLKLFVKEGGPSYSQIESYVKSGEELAKKIVNGEIAEGTTENARDLMWFLAARTCETDQHFLSGSLRMDDGDAKVFNFLNRCKGEEGNQSYGRISTHFGLYNQTLEDQGGKQRGLDMGNLHLPADKHTILFSRLPDGTTFIKLETHGCPPFWQSGFRSLANFQQFVGHTLDLFKFLVGHSSIKGFSEEAAALKARR